MPVIVAVPRAVTSTERTVVLVGPMHSDPDSYDYSGDSRSVSRPVRRTMGAPHSPILIMTNPLEVGSGWNIREFFRYPSGVANCFCPYYSTRQRRHSSG